MKKKLMAIISIAAIAVMIFGMLSSGAWFTDGASSNTNSIQAGTLSIDDGKVAETPALVIEKMAPGDVSGEWIVTIKNNGNLPLAWFGNLVVSESPLKSVIYIEDAKMEFVTPKGSWVKDNAGETLPVEHFIKEGKGFGPWPVVWTGPGNLATLAAFDGNNSMLPTTPYEFEGALLPGNSYVLHLKFGFYELADDTYQGLGPMTIKLVVSATQIKPGALSAIHSYLSNPGVVTWLEGNITAQTATALLP